MNFLIVDDSPIMRRIVINALKANGYESCLEAEDGRQGYEVLKSKQIDFVNTDWNMPVMTGLELVLAIRKDENLKNLPVLMITTRGAKEDILNALKAKVNNYLIKPFTPNLLKEKIQTIFDAVN